MAVGRMNLITIRDEVEVCAHKFKGYLRCRGRIEVKFYGYSFL